jgi:acetoin utilization protein AcuB
MLSSKEIMSSDILCIKSTDSILNAFRIMLDENIRHLPVVDEMKRLVGILSDRDIQRAMVFTSHENGQKEIFISHSLIVSEFMTSPVLTVSENSVITDIVRELLDKKVSALMVRDSLGSYIEIVTTDDLLYYFIDVLEKNEDLVNKPLSLIFSNTLF